IEYADLYRSDLYRDAGQLPDVSSAGGLIFMGGPMSVNDDLPYLRQEQGFIAQAIAGGKPVLGICLGAQLIAGTLGARVYRNPVKEIGWYPIRLEDAAADDCLFRELPPEHIVFHWHGETFDLPAAAVPLASSAACRHQAYRVGSNVYGLQFHLEVAPEMIA